MALRIVCTGVLLAFAWITQSPAQAAIKHQLDIPAQELGAALAMLAKQAKIQIVYSTALVEGQSSHAIVGSMTPEEALGRLLAKTGLKIEFLDAQTVTLSSASGSNVEPSPSVGGSPRHETTAPSSGHPQVRMAQAPTTSQPEPEQEREPKRVRQRELVELGEVVVTGTHIRGVETASPLFVFDQTDFDKAGAATAAQFLATLPQNFGGGHSEDTIFDSTVPDVTMGSGVNLRGLGPSSTLVLVNGRRQATGGGFAEYVDISMIPLGAVERIEVLTDGASAIYGSDAIGGVVNFVMRENYEGAETRLRGGGTTQGGGEEYQAAQSLGATWNAGNALLNYEYYRRNAVDSRDRDFSAGSPGPADLVPRQERHSVYISARQDLLQNLEISGDALYSERNGESNNFNQFAGNVERRVSDVELYAGSLGLTLEMESEWEVEAAANFSRDKTDNIVTSPSIIAAFPGGLPTLADYELWSVDAKLTGNLFHLQGGDIKMALGASYREESFATENRFRPRSETRADDSAAYIELMIPLVGASGDWSQTSPRLALTLAGRYENYDSFGNTFDPKFGIRWSPTADLSLRGTYGTSFKAPSVFQLNERLNGSANPFTLSGSRILILFGNNASLQEETASIWTAGIDVTPDEVPGLSAHITYFDVDYEDRILAPAANFRTIFVDPIYEGLVVRRSELPAAEFDALVAEFLSGQRIRVSTSCALPLTPTGACPEPVTNFVAVVDSRTNNLAGTRTRGADLTVSQRIPSRIGTFEFGLNASYLFDHAQQVTASAPEVDFVSTARNPIDFRARGSVGWSQGGWSVATAINYADSYANTTGSSQTSISSWTTVDLNLRYETAGRIDGGWLSDIALTLDVQNVFDRDPPFFADNFATLGYGLGFDSANADPLGRSISLSVLKSW